MREIQTYLPEARFIHLIRDGRDVALSVLKQDWGPQTIEAAAEKWRSRVLRGRAQQPYLGFYMEVKFEDLVLHTERELRRICEFVELDFDPAMLGYHETAEQRLQEKARALPRAHGEAQSAEKRLMSHAKTFEPPNPDLIGTWKQRMPPDDRAAFEALAGDLLADLGYELELEPADERGLRASPRRRGCRGRCAGPSSVAKHGTGVQRRRPSRATAGPVPDRRRALGDDPAAGDARRPSRPDDGQRDRLRPAARRDDPLRADDGRARDQGDGRRRPARGTRRQRGRDARGGSLGWRSSRRQRSCASSTRPRRQRRASAAGATRRPPT